MGNDKWVGDARRYYGADGADSSIMVSIYWSGSNWRHWPTLWSVKTPSVHPKEEHPYPDISYSCDVQVWMGSFVSCTLKHPDIFQYRCLKCGATIFPYRYAGSPPSGRVDLEGRCKCGCTGYESVSGWRVRAQTLRNQLAIDQSRYKSFKRNSPGNKVTVDMLLAEIHHHLFSALSFLLELPL